MKEQLEITSDYSKFIKHPFNRNVKRIQLLRKSMKKIGFHPGKALHVVEENGYYKVIDGHHRLEVAMSLGIPVIFVVCEDNISIPEIIATTNDWTTRDHLDSFVREGRVNYIAVKEYMDETGVSLGVAMNLLSGLTSGSGRKIETFKTGYFKLGDPWLADRIKDVVLHMRSLEIPFATNGLLVQALAKMMWVEEFSIHRFKHKLSLYKHLFEKQPTILGYMSAIQNIYNYRSTDKLPLAFWAEEAAKKRNVTYKAECVID